MQKINIKFEELINRIDSAVINLIEKFEQNLREIEFLKKENLELKENLYQTLDQIEKYTLELQQLKNEHINSNYKVK